MLAESGFFFKRRGGNSVPRAPVLPRMKFIFHNLGIYGFNILVCDTPYLSLWALSKQMTRLSALQTVMSWDAAW